MTETFRNSAKIEGYIEHESMQDQVQFLVKSSCQFSFDGMELFVLSAC